MSLIAGICEPVRLLAFMEAATAESTSDLLQRIRNDLHPGQLDSELARPQWLEAALSRLQEYERRASDKDQINTALIALEKQARLLRFEMS